MAPAPKGSPPPGPAWEGSGIPVHDRGKVLVQTALVLSGGGESCLDVEYLRTGDDLFGAVPSDTTVARTIHEITPEKRAALVAALAKVRTEVWRRNPAMTGNGPVVLDIDASLVEIHSENKEQAAPTYKGGYGFHPMFCFADATGETLAALLRPGNAGANTVADHISVLDAAIAQLPGDIAAGHPAGDDEELVRRTVVVRADSAGCTEDFLKACRQRHVGFYVSARSNAQITAAIFDAIGIEEVWLPALAQAGDPRDLDVTMRAHAHVERHICRLKDSGLTRFPFTSFEDNATWPMVVAMAADLVRWFQLVCLRDAWCDARPKALRWAIFHAPGHLVHSARRRIVRIIENWPTADLLVGAYERIALLT